MNFIVDPYMYEFTYGKYSLARLNSSQFEKSTRKTPIVRIFDTRQKWQFVIWLLKVSHIVAAL